MVTGHIKEGHAVKVRGSISGVLDPFRKQSQRQERQAMVAGGGCRGQIRNHIAGELESGWEGSPLD